MTMSTQSHVSNINRHNKSRIISVNGFKFKLFKKNGKVISRRMRRNVSTYKYLPFKYTDINNQASSSQSGIFTSKLNKRYSWTEKFTKLLEWDVKDGVYLQRRSAPILILFFFLLIINIYVCSLIWKKRSTFVECEIPYHQHPIGNPTFVTIAVTHKECNRDDKFKFLDSDEIFVYYKITNYPYLESSRSSFKLHDQLDGDVLTHSKILQHCTPIESIKYKAGKKMLHPCGIHAWNVFNDKIRFYRSSPTGSLAASIEIDESIPIATIPMNVQHFKNPSQDIVNKNKKNTYFWMLPENQDTKEVEDNECLGNTLSDALNYEKCGIGIENFHFITWMSESSFSSFKKYYGKIKGPLELPLYMSIENRYNVERFNGTKSIILSIPKWPYGSCQTLEIIQLVFTVLILIFTVIYATRNTRSSTLFQMYHESRVKNNKT